MDDVEPCASPMLAILTNEKIRPFAHIKPWSMNATEGERFADFNSDRGLQEVCESNGLTRSGFATTAPTFSHLDLFMGRVQNLKCARYFPGLKSMCVMKQLELKEISGLEQNSELETLWVNECQLATLSGLDGCHRLTTLHLSGNLLTSVGTGLATLQNLTTLWLCENKLQAIDGLHALPLLRVLWLCGNEIDTIGDGLKDNLQLEELNLAKNQVSSLRDLLHLQRLPKLTSLSLSDPHFGSNPVVQLSNYQTFVVHHLPKVQVLDAESVGVEAKALAGAIYVKKCMYYHMRCKTLKRAAANVATRAHELLRWHSAPTFKDARLLTAKAKELEALLVNHRERAAAAKAQRQLSLGVEVGSGDGGGGGGAVKAESKDEYFYSDLQGATSFLVASAPCPRQDDDAEDKEAGAGEEAEVRAVCFELRFLAAGLEKGAKELAGLVRDLACRAHFEVCGFSIARVMLEFETVGNVRLEEGKPSDSWFQSCSDLVGSRFDKADYSNAALKITGVTVSRVIRIHNRYLRWRFDQAVQKEVAAAEAATAASAAAAAAAAEEAEAEAAAAAAETDTAADGSSSGSKNSAAANAAASAKMTKAPAAAPNLVKAAATPATISSAKVLAVEAAALAAASTTSSSTPSSSEGDGGHLLEYLFYSDDPLAGAGGAQADRGRALRVAEEGFPRVVQQQQQQQHSESRSSSGGGVVGGFKQHELGPRPSIALASSTFGADSARLHKFNRLVQARKQSRHEADDDRAVNSAVNSATTPVSSSPPSSSSSPSSSFSPSRSPSHSSPSSSLGAPTFCHRRRMYRGEMLVVKALVSPGVTCAYQDVGSRSSGGGGTMSSDGYSGGATKDNEDEDDGSDKKRKKKKKDWHFFDHHALLPEYILCFEYSVEGDDPTQSPQPPPASLKAAAAKHVGSGELGMAMQGGGGGGGEFADYAPFLGPLVGLAQRLERARKRHDRERSVGGCSGGKREGSNGGEGGTPGRDTDEEDATTTPASPLAPVRPTTTPPQRGKSRPQRGSVSGSSKSDKPYTSNGRQPRFNGWLDVRAPLGARAEAAAAALRPKERILAAAAAGSEGQGKRRKSFDAAEAATEPSADAAAAVGAGRRTSDPSNKSLADDAHASSLDAATSSAAAAAAVVVVTNGTTTSSSNHNGCSDGGGGGGGQTSSSIDSCQALLSVGRLLSFAEAPRLDALVSLNLHAQGLNSVDELAVCHALRRLVLSGNKIKRFDALAAFGGHGVDGGGGCAEAEEGGGTNGGGFGTRGGGLRFLTELDLSFNSIQRVHHHHRHRRHQRRSGRQGSLDASAEAATTASLLAVPPPLSSSLSPASSRTSSPPSPLSPLSSSKVSPTSFSSSSSSSPWSLSSPWSCFPSLVALDLGFNSLSHSDEAVAGLRKLCPHLTRLDTRGNPRHLGGGVVGGAAPPPGNSALLGQLLGQRSSSLPSAAAGGEKDPGQGSGGGGEGHGEGGLNGCSSEGNDNGDGAGGGGAGAAIGGSSAFGGGEEEVAQRHSLGSDGLHPTARHRSLLLRSLPQLEWLDGGSVGSLERFEADVMARRATCLTLAHVVASERKGNSSLLSPSSSSSLLANTQAVAVAVSLGDAVAAAAVVVAEERVVTPQENGREKDGPAKVKAAEKYGGSSNSSGSRASSSSSSSSNDAGCGGQNDGGGGAIHGNISSTSLDTTPSASSSTSWTAPKAHVDDGGERGSAQRTAADVEATTTPPTSHSPHAKLNPSCTSAAAAAAAAPAVPLWVRRVTTLTVTHQGLRSLGSRVLGELPNLKRACFAHNELGASCLAELRKSHGGAGSCLEELSLEGNKSLRSLAGLVSSASTSLSAGREFLAYFPHLTRLDCSHCDLDSLSSLDPTAHAPTAAAHRGLSGSGFSPAIVSPQTNSGGCGTTRHASGGNPDSSTTAEEAATFLSHPPQIFLSVPQAAEGNGAANDSEKKNTEGGSGGGDGNAYDGGKGDTAATEFEFGGCEAAAEAEDDEKTPKNAARSSNNDARVFNTKSSNRNTDSGAAAAAADVGGSVGGAQRTVGGAVASTSSSSSSSSLSALCQLCLESNRISCLGPLSRLEGLMELYLGNNSVRALGEVDHLKALPKLIIVDLAGNPVCAQPEYRLYTLFCLKRLKVLDGSSVGSEEAGRAHDRFTGRLTQDALLSAVLAQEHATAAEAAQQAHAAHQRLAAEIEQLQGQLRIQQLQQLQQQQQQQDQQQRLAAEGGGLTGCGSDTFAASAASEQQFAAQQAQGQPPLLGQRQQYMLQQLQQHQQLLEQHHMLQGLAQQTQPAPAQQHLLTQAQPPLLLQPLLRQVETTGVAASTAQAVLDAVAQQQRRLLRRGDRRGALEACSRCAVLSLSGMKLRDVTVFGAGGTAGAAAAGSAGASSSSSSRIGGGGGSARSGGCSPFIRWRALVEVNLDQNALVTFSHLVDTLPSLIVLRLNHNKITSCGDRTHYEALLPGKRSVDQGSSGLAAGVDRGANPADPSSAASSVAKTNPCPLEVLLLGFNRVGCIDDLHLWRFPRLRVLHLQSNHLSSVAGLQGCGGGKLRELVLNKNKIRQLDRDGVAGLGALQELHLQENGLRSLEHFSHLSSLQSLHLAFNRVNDVSELEKHLGSLHHLVNLAMNNNPVARRQLYRPTLLQQLPALRWIDGREASWEERERAEMLVSRTERPAQLFMQQQQLHLYHQNQHQQAGLYFQQQQQHQAGLYLQQQQQHQYQQQQVSGGNSSSIKMAGGSGYTLPVPNGVGNVGYGGSNSGGGGGGSGGGERIQASPGLCGVGGGGFRLPVATNQHYSQQQQQQQQHPLVIGSGVTVPRGNAAMMMVPHHGQGGLALLIHGNNGGGGGGGNGLGGGGSSRRGSDANPRRSSDLARYRLPPANSGRGNR